MNNTVVNKKESEMNNTAVEKNKTILESELIDIKGKLTVKEKEKLLFINMLPKKHIVRELIKNEEITNEEIDSLILASSVATAANKRKTSNTVMTAILLSESERDKNKFLNEIKIRDTIVGNYTKNQKKSLRDYLTNGWGRNKEKTFIGKEIGLKLLSLSKSSEIKKHYASAGIDIEREGKNFIRTRGDYEKKLFKLYEKLDSRHPDIQKSIASVASDAKYRMMIVGDQFKRIKHGLQKRHIPSTPLRDYYGELELQENTSTDKEKQNKG